MSKIESEKVVVKKPIEEVFNFLSDFNNFQKLMPAQVTDWTSTKDECSFNLQGLAKIGMKMEERTPNSYIKVSSAGKVPFEFKLHVYLSELATDQTEGQLIFDADINPFMKMMVEKPLTNFVNMLIHKLKEVAE